MDEKSKTPEKTTKNAKKENEKMKANEPKFGRQLWLFVRAAAILT
jgi:hypothetical protein